MKCNFSGCSPLSKIIVGGLAALMVSYAAFGQWSNLMDMKWWFSQESLIWSAETNGFRTGVWWYPNSGNSKVDIWIMSSNRSGKDYVYPPSGKLPKLELLYTNGVLVQPIKDKMDDELPKRISVKDLPTVGPDGPFNGHGLRYRYFFINNGAPPDLLTSFSVSDVYRIKKEADYKLTVCPVIYKFETNYQYADRIDLPSVTTKIHLKP
jgi:hypothetical protein